MIEITNHKIFGPAPSGKYSERDDPHLLYRRPRWWELDFRQVILPRFAAKLANRFAGEGRKDLVGLHSLDGL